MKTWRKGEIVHLLIQNNIPFSHNAFYFILNSGSYFVKIYHLFSTSMHVFNPFFLKCHLLQRRQKASTCGKWFKQKIVNIVSGKWLTCLKNGNVGRNERSMDILSETLLERKELFIWESSSFQQCFQNLCLLRS